MNDLDLQPGAKFNKLTIMRKIAGRINGCIQYECLCDCGKIAVIRGNYIKSGKTKSCGCLAREGIIKRNRASARYTNMDPKDLKRLRGYLNVIKCKFNLDEEALVKLQNKYKGICPVCNRGLEHGKWVVDHCHITGRVRGILCKKCNSGLGLLNENISVVLNLVNYLSEN